MSRPNSILNQRKSFSYKIGRLVIRSLYQELNLSYKPGLVSFLDSGSHKDMDASTFMRSIFSLRHYFKDMVFAGINEFSFKQMQKLGIEAEKRMFSFTKGINTHKGSIFCMGILCAAIGNLHRKNMAISTSNISTFIIKTWKEDILYMSVPSKRTNGEKVKHIHGCNGAREEAANGFLSLVRIGVPSLKSTMNLCNNKEMALMQTLFFLMRNLIDTNVLHRTGVKGLKLVHTVSNTFIQDNGIYQKDWLLKVQKIHTLFVSKNISPGGSADLLAASWFLFTVEKECLCD